MDPEIPLSAFKIDPDTKAVAPAAGVPPVVNGFDENAVEAALRIKDKVGATITVVSVGKGFAMDVMKKPLSMGADQLVLVDDDLTEDLDAAATAYVLSKAIERLGDYDLVLCGRQASDWDNAHVPMGVAEMLDLPCVTMAQKVEPHNGDLVVERVLDEGYEVVENRHSRSRDRQQRAGGAALPEPARHHGCQSKVPDRLDGRRTGPGTRRGSRRLWS